MLALVIIVGLLVAFFTMSFWMPRSWYRALLYPGGRPNAVSSRLNALSDWAGSLGVAPTLMVSFETRGRRTGRASRVPLVLAELDGNRYLVSMLGEKADWVLNLRASNGEAVMRYGVVEPVKLEEVAIADRAPILRAYLKRATGARPHFDINYDAPLEEFARVAPRYPVFRILPREIGKPT